MTFSALLRDAGGCHSVPWISQFSWKYRVTWPRTCIQCATTTTPTV